MKRSNYSGNIVTRGIGFARTPQPPRDLVYGGGTVRRGERERTPGPRECDGIWCRSRSGNTTGGGAGNGARMMIEITAMVK